jgi:hypothetical protein
MKWRAGLPAVLMLVSTLLAACHPDLVVFLPSSATTPAATAVPATVTVPAAEPTVAPTAAPGETEAEPAAPAEATTPEAPASGQGPRVLNSGAQKTSYASDASCTTAQEAVLTINTNGTATLSVTGPGIIDHYNCTPSDAAEGWYAEGVDSPADERVTFTTCNMGGFDAAGELRYAGGVLSGEVTCIYKKGSASGQVAVRFVFP